MRISILIAAILSTCALVQPALAQSTGAAVTSSPGKVGVAQTVDFSATITAIDKATRTITLKGPKGEEQKVVAGPEVKNFDQLKVGDTVTAQYIESLVLELKKGGGKKVEKTEKSAAAAANRAVAVSVAVGARVGVSEAVGVADASDVGVASGPSNRTSSNSAVARPPEEGSISRRNCATAAPTCPAPT